MTEANVDEEWEQFMLCSNEESVSSEEPEIVASSILQQKRAIIYGIFYFKSRMS